MHVPPQFWVEVGQGASWAGIAGGLLPLLSLGAVVVPRIAFRGHLPVKQEMRARPLLIATLAAAAVVLVSAVMSIVSTIMVDGPIGAYRGSAALTVADAIGVALLAGVTGVVACFSLAYWPADAVDKPKDTGIAPSGAGPSAPFWPWNVRHEPDGLV